jgi:hypothetical protein
LTHLDRDEFAAVFHDGFAQQHRSAMTLLSAPKDALAESFLGAQNDAAIVQEGHHRLCQAARVGPAPVGHPVDGLIADSYEKSAKPYSVL